MSDDFSSMAVQAVSLSDIYEATGNTTRRRELGHGRLGSILVEPNIPDIAGFAAQM